MRPMHTPLEGVAAIRRAEDRAAEVGDAANFVRAQGHQLRFTEQAAEPPSDPYAFPATMHRAEDNGADNGIEARRVTAAGGDRNSHFLPAVPSRISRPTSADSASGFVPFLEYTRRPATSTPMTPPTDVIN